jgi:hypothetical protein
MYLQWRSTSTQLIDTLFLHLGHFVMGVCATTVDCHRSFLRL